MNGRHLNALRPSAGGRCCFRDEIRTPQPQAEKPDRAGVNCDTTPHRIGAKEHGLVFLDHPQTDVDFLEDLQILCPCVEILRLWNAERNTAPEMPRALRKAAWARSTQEDRSSRCAQLAAHGRTAYFEHGVTGRSPADSLVWPRNERRIFAAMAEASMQHGVLDRRAPELGALVPIQCIFLPLRPRQWQVFCPPDAALADQDR